MSPRRRRVAIVAVLVAGLAGFAVWRLVLAPPAVPPGVIAVSGRIEGDNSAVAAKTSGRIREITVREGDPVEAGQVIAELDDEQIRAREGQASAAVRQAEARVRLAQHQITVLNEQLQQSRFGVDQARADAQGRVSEAEGKLAAAEAQLAQAEAAHTQAKWDREAMGRLFKRELVAEQEARRAESAEDAQAAVVAAARRQVEAARGSLTAAQANLLNPAIRSSQVAAYVLRIDPQASFTPENTYFREDRVKQVIGVKLRLRGAVGFAKPGMPADGEILVDGGQWPLRPTHR